MRNLTRRLVLGVALVSLGDTCAGAQGGVTASLSGTAVDTAGGVVPGASVAVKNKGTGATFTAVTSGSGTFSIPSLDAGLYTVNVSLMGFKTAILDDVRLIPGVP